MSAEPTFEQQIDELRNQVRRLDDTITVLIYYYSKLIQLRKGNPEEWDEVDELYVHD